MADKYEWEPLCSIEEGWNYIKTADYEKSMIMCHAKGTAGNYALCADFLYWKFKDGSEKMEFLNFI